MISQAVTDFLHGQQYSTPRQVLFNSRLLIFANLFFLYPDTLLLGPSARSVHLIRAFFILSLTVHSVTLQVSRRRSLIDGLIFMVLAGVGTIAVSLAVGSAQTRYILSLPLIFIWCATTVPTSPRAILAVNSFVIFMYIILSLANHDTGHLAQFSSIIFLLFVSTYASFFLVKTSNRNAIEQLELKQKATEKADQLNEANFQLQKTSQQLRALDQAKSSFFANINNDLRIPLRLVMLNLQSAEEKLDHTFLPGVASHLKNAHFNALRLFSLVRDILTLTSIDMQKFRLKVSQIDLALMLRSIVGDVAALAIRKNIEVILDTPPTSTLGYIITADPDQLDRVFINLLTNAVEFTPPGGRVAVRLVPFKDTVTIYVRDSGPGIPAPMLPHIFSRDFQSSSSVKSSPNPSTSLGIGLNLVKSIVTAHQGTVEVSNNSEAGAEFKIVFKRLISLSVQSLEQRQRSVAVQHERRAALPVDSLDDRFEHESRLSRMHHITIGDPHIIPNAAAPGSAHLLILENDSDLAKTLGDILSTYNLAYATNGTIGLKMARRSRPDLIITHDSMESESGVSLLTDLRADVALDNIPTILITENRSLDHQRQASQQGVDAVLSQPLDVHVVRATVSRLLARERRYVTALMDRNRESLTFFVQGLAHNVLNALNIISGSLEIAVQDFHDLAVNSKNTSTASTDDSKNNYAAGMAAIDRVHQSIIALQRCVDDSQAKEPETVRVDNLVRRALIAAGGSESIRLEVQSSANVRVQAGQIERAVVDLLRAAKGPDSTPYRVHILVGSTKNDTEVFIEIAARRDGLPTPHSTQPTSSQNSVAVVGGDLALAVVRMVVRNHNGRLDVDHDPMLELRYRITLPLEQQAPQRSS